MITFVDAYFRCRTLTNLTFVIEIVIRFYESIQDYAGLIYGGVLDCHQAVLSCACVVSPHRVVLGGFDHLATGCILLQIVLSKPKDHPASISHVSSNAQLMFETCWTSIYTQWDFGCSNIHVTDPGGVCFNLFHLNVQLATNYELVFVGMPRRQLLMIFSMKDWSDWSS